MKKITDDKLLMYCTVAAVILFTWWASHVCVTIFDQVLMVLFAVGLLCIPYVVRWKEKKI